MNMFKKLNFYTKFSNGVNSIKVVLLLFGILLSLSGCEKITPPMLPEVSTPETEPLTSDDLQCLCRRQYRNRLLAVENLLQVPTGSR